ncbi:nucleoside/nucleotide kinase family protein [Pontivivens ytuae]|uniref:Nucleoside/nucleotide kinase family protein n=1 Tax=Pontivivens ytuae TaxID=2789856 RepID=A0A7S9LNV0_9RHOB|nr:nucleoside/nucleotide kinase family protein [Pontivivens ytuae]QPH52562.1 nucleoside/nucleotide kinase family protein [Pontivivens ytuae]
MDIEALRTELRTLIPAQGRLVMGLVGPPASGKSTLSKRLAAGPDAVVLPMDGFHLDDDILRARGDLPRKGAEWTFDRAGLAAMLARVRAGEEVFAPRFDRSMELSRAGAIRIAPEHRLVVVEGNWLSLWPEVREQLSPIWHLNVDEGELRRRLEQRWAAMTPEARRVKIEENDLPNARAVAALADRADRVVRSA